MNLQLSTSENWCKGGQLEGLHLLVGVPGQVLHCKYVHSDYMYSTIGKTVRFILKGTWQ
jgi:hypothetical protein